MQSKNDRSLIALLLVFTVAITMVFAGSTAAQDGDVPAEGKIAVYDDTDSEIAGSPYTDFSTAYDNADENYTLKLGPGTFTFVDPEIDGLTIDGDGIDKTYLTGGQMNPDAVNLTLRDFTMNAPGANIYIRDGMQADGFRMENVKFSGNQQTSIAFQIAAAETVTDRADGLHIENVTIERPGVKGIYLERAHNAVLKDIVVDGVPNTGNENPPSNGIDINLKYDDYKNLTIEDTVVRGVERDDFGDGPTWNAAIAIKARDDGDSYSDPPATLTGVTINNVTIENSIAGLRFGEPGVDYDNHQGPTDVTITDSTFQNNENYHVEDLSGSVDLATVEDENTFDQSVVFKDRIHPSIQAAVDYAEPGDTVEVGPGTYEESVTIDTENVTLKGPNAGTLGYESRGEEAIIDAGGSEYAVLAKEQLGEVTIDGFLAKNWTKVGIVQGMSNSEGTTFHVLNNDVDVTGQPIAHGNPIQVTGDDSTVKGNAVEVTGYDGVVTEWAPTGILVEGADRALVKDNYVQYVDTDEDSDYYRGITIEGTDGGYGGDSSPVNEATVKNNTVVGLSTGISVQLNATNVDIVENTVKKNDIGIAVRSYQTKGHNNKVAKEEPKNVEIHKSDIYDNKKLGLRNSVSNEVDATRNWWGEEHDGPPGKSKGLPDDNRETPEDRVAGKVDFRPWLPNPVGGPDKPKVDKPNSPGNGPQVQSFTASPNPITSNQQVTFSAQGVGVDQLRVKVFNTTGAQVYDSNFHNGSTVSWNLVGDSGERLANGLYLFALSAKVDGEIQKSEIRQLLVIN